MDDPTSALQPQPYPRGTRQLQDAALHGFQHPQAHNTHATLPSQLDPQLHDLDGGNAFPLHFDPRLNDAAQPQPLRSDDTFERAPQQPQYHGIRPKQPETPRPRSDDPGSRAGQFGILTPNNASIPGQSVAHDAVGRLQQENNALLQTPEQNSVKGEHFSNLKLIANPPDLERWRERLFNVDDTITLTEEEFQIYFPHVDNIYSHRSTQRYKRKPFVSHYWDCRLKGRPPGTPKSDDPNKRKRKRQARERDLCDVKIKITEFFPEEAETSPRLASQSGGPSDASTPFAPGENYMPDPQSQRGSQAFGVLSLGQDSSDGRFGHGSERHYTVQRVNGNGGNGKADGVAGPHKHSLEESDRVKKNSVQRHFLKEEKQKKKVEKTYHKKATGAALNTVKKHSKDHELKLYGSCFCPFVQRVWIALEVKGINYQYIEVDPYKKPESLLAVNPRGLVPALRYGDWGCYESTVLMEFLEDLGTGEALLPPGDPQARANCRLWSDHINRHIIPSFYAYLQAQDPQDQKSHARTLTTHLATLISAAHPTGPFFLGPTISFVDIQLAPWLIRMRKVLQPYRGWPDPVEIGGPRWANWVEAIEGHESVMATTSSDELYLDSYERYAENRPDTSQVARAVNEGRGLP